MSLREKRVIRVNRRDFLKALGAASLFAAVNGRGMSSWNNTSEPFEFLVIGDSLIWGQGLPEADKFYTLTEDWLRKEVFRGTREVALTVKAHSGATIRFDPKEATKYRASGKDESSYYPGEVNVSTPSMFKQVEMAADDHKKRGVARGADLVMLTAGITDIAVEGVLDPFGDIKKLELFIAEVCRGRVGSLLENIAQNNPDALIAVVGYYPILSENSSSSKVFNAWLETLNVPSFIQGLLNNPVMRPIVFSKLLKRAIKRSRLWISESDRNFRAAIADHNAKVGREQAIFIKAPLTEENVVESPKTMLFRMRKDGTVEDPLYAQRKIECKVALDELKRTTGVKYSPKRCSYAAVGHPDKAGAKLYAEAITRELRPFLVS
ncbi:MAG TPA: hypothetical protein PLP21_00545 [Pyrinomonadaceae bacterium]|nr:hypothetical protein [Acidobacteriota bacterium]HQZ94768.1 hypothetical protein [Pyrinomonadaceae bacterium]